MPQVQPVPAQQAPPPQPVQQAQAPWQQPAPQPAPQYYLPQPQPQQPDPVQLAMVQALQAITEKLSQPQAPAVPVQEHKPLTDINFEAEKQAMLEERKRLDAMRNAPKEPMTPTEEGVRVPEDAGLDFLTTPPSSPKIQVMFDLGRGGRHLKRYHHVAVTGIWLTLIYDSRFEGDQFIPPVAQDGDPPIIIQFPQHGRTVKAAVPNGANQRIGCMDLINFVIIGESEDQQQTAPTFDGLGQLGAEIQQMSNELGAIQ
jgi:hypothetical protein